MQYVVKDASGAVAASATTVSYTNKCDSLIEFKPTVAKTYVVNVTCIDSNGCNLNGMNIYACRFYTPSSSSSSSSSSLSPGAIVGIVIGVIAGVALLIWFITCCIPGTCCYDPACCNDGYYYYWYGPPSPPVVVSPSYYPQQPMYPQGYYPQQPVQQPMQYYPQQPMSTPQAYAVQSGTAPNKQLMSNM